jgi:dTDP-4-amino-4,6-dideoxygalactose transaminase
MIPYGKQSIDTDEVNSVSKVLLGDWLTTGPEVEIFENELQKYAGAPCIAVSSGTAALHCAYVAIGLTVGDEIITPPITFIATQSTAVLLGAKIVFADVQQDTGNIDPRSVESLINSRTKAIVAVDYAGHPAELNELKQIAEKYNIYLIEDAAHSLGSKYQGLPIGCVADITTFSFFPTKNITTAEGGAVASLNPKLLERAKKFARQGLIKNQKNQKLPNEGPWHQEVHEFGLNYRLPDVLCAIGTSQLKKIEHFKDLRSEIFNYYSRKLKSIPNLTLPTKLKHVDPMWHLYPIRVNPKNRKSIFLDLKESGIGVQVNYLPAYWHPVFQDLGYKRGLCPEAERFYESEISLPIYPSLSKNDQELVIDALSAIMLKY